MPILLLAYTKDNRAHVIYPGGISKDDWVHDLPLLIRETWSHPWLIVPASF